MIQTNDFFATVVEEVEQKGWITTDEGQHIYLNESSGKLHFTRDDVKDALKPPKGGDKKPKDGGPAAPTRNSAPQNQTYGPPRATDMGKPAAPTRNSAPQNRTYGSPGQQGKQGPQQSQRKKTEEKPKSAKPDKVVKPKKTKSPKIEGGKDPGILDVAGLSRMLKEQPELRGKLREAFPNEMRAFEKQEKKGKGKA